MTFVDPARMVPDLAGRDCDGVRDVQPLAESLKRALDAPMYENVPDPNLSDRALALVNGPRQDEYAPPRENMRRIGQVWAALLGLEKPILSWQVSLMLAGLKVVRAANTPSDDSLVDAVGYLEITERLRPEGGPEWSDLGLAGGKK